MKYVIVLMLLAAMVVAGCIGQGGVVINSAQVARNVGTLVVYSVYRAEVITRLDIEAVLPYLVMMRDCVAAEPGDAVIVLAEFAEYESERWGIGIPIEDRRIAIDILLSFFSAIKAEPEGQEVAREQSAILTLAVLDGMIHAATTILR